VEIHHLNIRPADFFTSNPALDVPAVKDKSSVIVACCGGEEKKRSDVPDASVQQDAVAHRQGPGPDLGAAEAGFTVQQS
jgi:primary-amine oxidase